MKIGTWQTVKINFHDGHLTNSAKTCTKLVSVCNPSTQDVQRSSVLTLLDNITTSRYWAYRSMLSWRHNRTALLFMEWSNAPNVWKQSSWVRVGPMVVIRRIPSLHVTIKIRKVKNFLRYYFHPWVSHVIFAKSVLSKVLYQQNSRKYPVSETWRTPRGEQFP